MADVFISYKREDQPLINLIRAALERFHITVWSDAKLTAGEIFNKEIEQEAKSCRAMLVCWSDLAVGSPWVISESEIGLSAKKLVACQVSGPTGLVPPPPFNTIHAADLIGWTAIDDATKAGRHAGWQAILNRLGALLDRPGLASYAALPPEGSPERKPQIEAWHRKYTSDPLAPALWDEYRKLRLAEMDAELTSQKQVAEERAAEEAKRKAALGNLNTPVAQKHVAPPTPHLAQAPARGKSKAVREKRKAPRGLAAVFIGGIVVVATGAVAAGGFVALTAWKQQEAVAATIELAGSTPAPTQAPVVRSAKDAIAAVADFIAARDPFDPVAATPGQLAQRDFTDCGSKPYCPVMTVVPAGSFLLGSKKGPSPFGIWHKDEHLASGQPQRVSVPAFAIGKYEITWRQYSVCVQQGPCDAPAALPPAEAKGGIEYPVWQVSWNNARQYAGWLSSMTKETYRLPTETEWEYAAEGGLAYDSPYSFDQADGPPCKYMNGLDDKGWAAKKAARNLTDENKVEHIPLDCDDGYAGASPVGKFLSNGYGLHDMHGNLWEWVQDCYPGGVPYPGNHPFNGKAYEPADCKARGRRGGSWLTGSDLLRSAGRGGEQPDEHSDIVGFRLVRELPAMPAAMPAPAPAAAIPVPAATAPATPATPPPATPDAGGAEQPGGGTP